MPHTWAGLKIVREATIPAGLDQCKIHGHVESEELLTTSPPIYTCLRCRMQYRKIEQIRA